MERILQLRGWIDAHRDGWLDVLRVYMGFALLAKALAFARDMASLAETVSMNDIPVGSVYVAHYVVMAHLVGGLLLVFGVLTRLAAAVQIPILLGAVLYVHGRTGLFGPAQSLELDLLVLFILALLVVAGGGRWSFDGRLREASRPPQLASASP